TELKKAEETKWLNEVSSVPVQQTLRHLQGAFSNFFEKVAKYPTFKKKDGKQSAEYTRSGFQWDAGTRTLTVAKLGPIKIKWSREFSSNPSTVTLSRDQSGRYFVSLRLDEAIEKFPEATAAVGIDLGINRTMTLSDGTRIGNPRYTAKYEARLTRLQRRLAKKRKGSANRAKAKRKVAKLHTKIDDCRKDFTHKATTRIVRDNHFEKVAKYPTFKKKDGKQSAEYTRSGFQWDAGTRTLTVAKLGPIKIKWSREFSSNPSTVTLSRDQSGRYFVSLRLDEAIEKFPEATAAVGIDLGINRTMTLSDGTRIGNPRYTAKYEARLTRLQRRLAKERKGSANRAKAKRKV